MKRLLFPLVMLLAAALSAQVAPIQHTPATCIPSEQNAILDVQLASKGAPRVYFRREGAENWCWVAGTRLADHATFVLPKFESGPVIQYYFLTIDENDVVTGKSKDVYRVPSSEHCDAMVARHLEYVLTNCDDGALASAIGAGLEIRNAPPPGEPSPSIPGQ